MRASKTSSFPEIYSPTARTATIFFYGGDTVHAQFIQIPVELLSDRRVSALELRLYAILLRYGLEGRGFSQAGHRLLASNCSCHLKTIARCLKNLQSIGWITIERVGLNRNSKIRCLKTVQRAKPEGTKGSYQEKTPGRPPTTSIDRRKNRDRRDSGLTDEHKTPLDQPNQGQTQDIPNVQETPPDSPNRVASGYESAENRKAGDQFKEAQQALTTALEENIRPASLYWFQNAIITDDTADELTISVGNDEVGLVQEQYSSLLGKLMNKKVIFSR